MAGRRVTPANETKKPFVPAEDRPEVRIDLDTPLTELSVRDLSTILGFVGSKTPFEVGKTPIKDFFDKEWPEVVKDWVKESKEEKAEKPEKPEKYEKNEKIEKPEKEKREKLEKPEKLEKREIKELKVEKLENDGVFEREIGIGPDPRIEQIVHAVAGLTKQVGQLADQVEELRKRAGG